jgi:hypothetical protein
VDKRRSSKNSDVAILSKTRAAAHLIEQHPEYKNITSKSLVNRAGEAYKRKKQTPGVPLSAPLEQYLLAARRRLQSPPEK